MAGERGGIRVVMVDNHPLTREGTRACLERVGGIEVAAMAGEGRVVLPLLEEHQPEVLILEVKLPDVSGIDVARQVRAGFPQVRILVLTSYDEAINFQAVLWTGVHGYLPKSVPCEVLAPAVRTVAMGGTLLGTMSDREIWPGGDWQITPRERAVLSGLAQGKRNSEIAADLGVAVKTVECHMGNILSKLEARNRTQAVLKACEMGLVPAGLRGVAPSPPRTPIPFRKPGPAYPRFRRKTSRIKPPASGA